jgi:hypothetical protein
MDTRLDDIGIFKNLIFDKVCRNCDSYYGEYVERCQYGDYGPPKDINSPNISTCIDWRLDRKLLQYDGH